MKKILPVIALVLVMALLFVSCGGADAPAAEKATEEKVEKAAESAGEDAKTIVYWSLWESTEKQGIVIQEAADAYMAATGNVVDLQFKGRTGIREGLQPALDGGMVIDMFCEDIDRVNGVWGDYLLDLEDLVAASGYEETATPALIAAARNSGGGTLKSIPYQPFLFAFAYNKDILNEAGVSATPKTWDELLDVCGKVKAAGYIPLTCDDAYMSAWFGYALARNIGEDGVVDVVTNGNWAEEAGVLEMAKRYEDLASKGYISPNIASNVWPQGQNVELALGEAAMYINGTWLPNEVSDITGPEFNWGFFNYPAVPGGVDGIEAANFGSQVFGINKNSEVAEEALEFITYITKGEYDLKLAQESLGIPAEVTNTEWPAQLLDAQVIMSDLTTRYAWAASAENNVDMTPVIKENFIKLCAGQMTAQEFVDTLEAASN